MSNIVLQIVLTSGREPLKIKREVCYRKQMHVDNNGHDTDDNSNCHLRVSNEHTRYLSFS
jgi:hypothetical protein